MVVSVAAWLLPQRASCTAAWSQALLMEPTICGAATRTNTNKYTRQTTRWTRMNVEFCVVPNFQFFLSSGPICCSWKPRLWLVRSLQTVGSAYDAWEYAAIVAVRDVKGRWLEGFPWFESSFNWKFMSRLRGWLPVITLIWYDMIYV